jgi:hypothetical protein
VTNGNCLLERNSGKTFKLEAGSIVLLPQGDPHVVRSVSRGGSSGTPIRTEYNNAIRIKTNARGASDTEMICGRLRLDGANVGVLMILYVRGRLCDDSRRCRWIDARRCICGQPRHLWPSDRPRTGV